MLPPSQFGGNSPQWDSMDNQDVFENKAQFDRIERGIEHWSDGSGFDVETWLQGMTEIRDYHFGFTEDKSGKVLIEVSFTFDFDIGDGEYTGTRSVSYTY